MNTNMIAKTLTLALALSSAFAADALEKPKAPEKPEKNRAKRVEVSRDSNLENKFGFAWPSNNSDIFANTTAVQNNVNRIWARAGSGVEQPLVISTGGLDPKAIAEMEEDLTIMSRILNKAVREGKDDGDRKAMGIHLYAIGQGPGARNLYIEGTGAIFVMNVGLPLAGSRAKEEGEEKPKEAANSDWESAKREVFGEESGPRYRALKERRGASFDPDKVEDLKNSMIEALKNAANIRGLKDNETVTIVLQGAASGEGSSRVMTKDGELRVETFAFAAGGAGPKSVLTIRAKKSDIDALAKGRLDGDAFRKKVTATTYQSQPREK
jgi:hypothetical protein